MKKSLSKFMVKFCAFTLAETLIVMGIIGIVSALTLPNLNSSTGEKEKVAKVKKLYQNLTDAYGRMEAIYGPINEWTVGDSDGNVSSEFLERMSEFMKVSKYCGTTNPDDCYYYDESGKKNTSLPTMVTADGTGILVWATKNCSKLESTDVSATCGTILIDIDGRSKGKNEDGYDKFSFSILEDEGIVPRQRQSKNYNSATTCLGWKTACSGWVIDYGNMDYLKVNSQNKCPNGTVLNATVTSCK